MDANVLIAASLVLRWPYEVLRAARDQLVDVVLPEQVIHEATRNLRTQTRAFLLATLEQTPHERVPMPLASEADADLVRDTEDIPIALALLAADVDYLVTNDRDFTDPGRCGGAVQPSRAHHAPCGVSPRGGRLVVRRPGGDSFAYLG